MKCASAASGPPAMWPPSSRRAAGLVEADDRPLAHGAVIETCPPRTPGAGAPCQSEVIAAFNVALGRIAADVFSVLGK